MVPRVLVLRLSSGRLLGLKGHIWSCISAAFSEFSSILVYVSFLFGGSNSMDGDKWVVGLFWTEKSFPQAFYSRVWGDSPHSWLVWRRALVYTSMVKVFVSKSIFGLSKEDSLRMNWRDSDVSLTLFLIFFE